VTQGEGNLAVRQLNGCECSWQGHACERTSHRQERTPGGPGPNGRSSDAPRAEQEEIPMTLHQRWLPRDATAKQGQSDTGKWSAAKRKAFVTQETPSRKRTAHRGSRGPASGDGLGHRAWICVAAERDHKTTNSPLEHGQWLQAEATADKGTMSLQAGLSTSGHQKSRLIPTKTAVTTPQHLPHSQRQGQCGKRSTATTRGVSDRHDTPVSTQSSSLLGRHGSQNQRRCKCPSTDTG
jgi:hypothetical protein